MSNELLASENDFKWHKRKLDAAMKQQFKHFGTPDRYPCKVESQLAHNDNGPDEYYHSFIYKQEVECPHCKVKTLIWPEV